MAGAIISSTSRDWNTPSWLVEAVLQTFDPEGIDLDPCSNEHSLVPAKVRICLPMDGLAVEWDYYNTVFINPPYGRDQERGTSISDWTEKASNAEKAACIVVIPASVDTKHWHEFVFPKAKSICFIEGRVKFGMKGNYSSPTTGPTAAILFNPQGKMFNPAFRQAFEQLGKVFHEFR
jgi:hypothetical protein